MHNFTQQSQNLGSAQVQALLMFFLWLVTIKTSRSSHWRCSVKKVLLKFWQNSQENTCGAVSFLNKVAGLNTFFCRTPPVAASEHLTMVPSGSKAQRAFVGQLFYKTLHRHHHR